MKKTLLAAALLLGALTINAQDYKNSIGANVGNMFGVSYKGFIFGVDGLALQADLGVKLSNWGKAMTISTHVHGEGFDQRTTNSGTASVSMDYFTFELNPNIVYQRPITSGSWGSLSWFAGGGISLGLMKSGAHGDYYWDENGNKHDFFWAVSQTIEVPTYDDEGEPNGTKKEAMVPVTGKFGFNAIGGVEMKMANLPLAFSLDFRPGYGMQFDVDKTDGVTTETQTHFFDWTLAAAIRYCF
ncbi:MAG: hypothetical protein J6W92_03500 [Paludibacteraceae bacterium]|nr:hypothetical protein [Paludibacteraceae bacterium]